jgi:putative resolvase
MDGDKKTCEYVSVKEASAITGIGPQTLRLFADQKKIACYKTPSGQRKFHKPSLQAMCQSFSPSNDASSSPTNSNLRYNYLYARVSSKHQLEDLSRQIEFLKTHHEYSSYDVIQDIASGINFKRKGLQTILDKCLQGSIGHVIVAHKDRLARFGFDLIESIVRKAGGQVIVLDHPEHGQTNEQELAEDLLSIVHVFNCRQMGKRRYKAREIIEVSQDQNLPNESSSSEME